MLNKEKLNNLAGEIWKSAERPDLEHTKDGFMHRRSK